jgi:hypothetical protein
MANCGLKSRDGWVVRFFLVGIFIPRIILKKNLRTIPKKLSLNQEPFSDAFSG